MYMLLQPISLSYSLTNTQTLESPVFIVFWFSLLVVSKPNIPVLWFQNYSCIYPLTPFSTNLYSRQLQVSKRENFLSFILFSFFFFVFFFFLHVGTIVRGCSCQNTYIISLSFDLSQIRNQSLCPNFWLKPELWRIFRDLRPWCVTGTLLLVDEVVWLVWYRLEFNI